MMLTKRERILKALNAVGGLDARDVVDFLSEWSACIREDADILSSDLLAMQADAIGHAVDVLDANISGK